MPVVPSARTRRHARLFAAVFLPALALSLSACAGEQTAPTRLLARALDTNLSPGPAPDAAPMETSSASGDYLVGRFALDIGDYDRAADSLDRALAADPGDPDLRRQVFLLRLANGEYDRAVAAAAALVELDPGADEALLLLALDRARAGDYASARQQLQKMSARGAIGLVAPIIEAWAMFGTGDVAGGLDRLGGKPGAEQGLDLLRRYQRAVMLDLTGRAAEGVPLLADREAHPGNLPLRLVETLAQLHLDSGDHAAAEKVIADALAANTDDPQLLEVQATLRRGARLLPVTDPKAAMGDALIGVAEALLDQQATAQALLLARAAVFVAPTLVDAPLLVGRILLAQGNAAGAADALASIPDSAPESWSARLLRSQALRDEGKAGDAVELLRGMTAARPHRTDALIALGDLFRRDERYAEAEAAYGEAIGRLGTPAADDWRLFYARGMALERLNRWPEAEASLKKALALQPDQPLVLNYLGYSWVDRGENLAEGERMLNRAVELKPDDGYIVDSLGWAYFRLGQYDKAVTYLERAVEIEPGDPVINDHLGDAYWRIGRQREARFQWTQALAFKPEPDVAGQIQGKLDRGLPQAAPTTRG